MSIFFLKCYVMFCYVETRNFSCYVMLCVMLSIFCVVMCCYVSSLIKNVWNRWKCWHLLPIYTWMNLTLFDQHFDPMNSCSKLTYIIRGLHLLWNEQRFFPKWPIEVQTAWISRKYVWLNHFWFRNSLFAHYVDYEIKIEFDSKKCPLSSWNFETKSVLRYLWTVSFWPGYQVRTFVWSESTTCQGSKWWPITQLAIVWESILSLK